MVMSGCHRLSVCACVCVSWGFAKANFSLSLWISEGVEPG